MLARPDCQIQRIIAFGNAFVQPIGLPGPTRVISSLLLAFREPESHAGTDLCPPGQPLDPLGRYRGADIEALFVALGAEVSEREGSRVGMFLFGEVRVFHRPHPSPDADKGAVASVRKWLDEYGVKP